MKRKLITQMRSEWRGNIWLVVEFLLVALILWYVCMQLYSLYWLYSPSKGYDFDNVYLSYIGGVPESAPGHISYESEEAAKEADRANIATLVNSIRQNPDVEEVGTGSNAVPYNYNYMGNMLWTVDKGDTLVYNYNRRVMDANTVKALRIRGSRGESTEQIASYIEDGLLVLSEFDPATIELYSLGDSVRNFSSRFAAKNAHIGDKSYRVSPVTVNYLRRTDYEFGNAGVMICSPEVADDQPGQIIIRVKPGAGRRFYEWIQTARLRVGNLYVAKTESLDRLKDSVHAGEKIVIVRMSLIMAFMLILIFLGFLGTYWFRIQQRVPEIAIRKAMGATNARIACRMFSEGYILMGISLALFGGIAVWLSLSGHMESVMPYPTKWIYKGMAMTAAVMLLMVVAGIWFPARKAMRINPATALKDQ